MTRNEYSVSIVFNGRFLNRIIIDQHYKIGHPEMTDEIILPLVRSISGDELPPESRRDDLEYFKLDTVFYNQKPYRLIFIIDKNDDYLGVINAFRTKRVKNGR